MLDKDFLRGIKILSDFNYVYDILVFPEHLKAVKKFVKALPPMRLIIDHIAKPKIGKKERARWAQSKDK